jgi:hypothetical protein
MSVRRSAEAACHGTERTFATAVASCPPDMKSRTFCRSAAFRVLAWADEFLRDSRSAEARVEHPGRCR